MRAQRRRARCAHFARSRHGDMCLLWWRRILHASSLLSTVCLQASLFSTRVREFSSGFTCACTCAPCACMCACLHLPEHVPMRVRVHASVSVSACTFAYPLVSRRLVCLHLLLKF